ncbi:MULTISPECIES: metalloregulator ArsR/SmtB family transcription factor [unclassified Crossiella]|uniref:ArsR/SmtB family transcription factor n=1 Tax=unclassified Crossiella TaxID=2620835 RepID=UPI0027E54D84|nr:MULTISPECIES: metalloregulator ArsR/SmtB family transcription factor [unclassified Crossiella]
MDFDAVFKALADPTRRRLLDALHTHDGQRLHELCAGTGLTRQAVTKHLAILEAANLVATTRSGREKLHYLNPAPLNDITNRWLGKYNRQHLQALATLKKALEDNDE